jgi:hypothetical protein
MTDVTNVSFAFAAHRSDADFEAPNVTHFSGKELLDSKPRVKKLLHDQTLCATHHSLPTPTVGTHNGSDFLH